MRRARPAIVAVMHAPPRLLLVCSLLITVASAQTPPANGPAETEPGFQALVGGDVVVRPGERIASATLVLRGGAPAQHLSVDVTGVHQLTLNVGDGGDGNGHDNADWAGTELHCAA